MSLQRNSDDYDAYDPNQAVIDMIDINTLHLNGLRTECVLTEALTQMEIRVVEAKLIRLFGKQAIERQIALCNKNSKVPSPSLRKWLEIVGLNERPIESIIKKIGDDFDKLLSCSQEELSNLVIAEATADERRRLLTAMSNLKLFIEKLKVNDTTVNDLDLHWDSWDQQLLEQQKQKQQESAYINEDVSLHNDELSENRSSCPSPMDDSSRVLINSHEQLDNESNSRSSSKELFKSSPSTPPFPKHNNNINPSYSNHKLPVTPPISRKFNTNHPHSHHHPNFDSNYNNTSMPKSKSHEGHLMNKIDLATDCHTDNQVSYNRPRLVSEPYSGADSKLHNCRSPPVTSPDNYLYSGQSDNCFDEPTSSPHSLTNSTSNINAPRSPRTQGMLHSISHRFVNRLRMKIFNCNLCQKPVMFGVKCKECKFRCHKECANKVPPSCGLPPKYFEIFKQTINSRTPISSSSSAANNPSNYIGQGSWSQQASSTGSNSKQNTNKKNSNKPFKSQPIHPKRHSPDSSNASSRNSSAPSSPIQPLTTGTMTTTTSGSGSTFTFNKTDKNSSSSSYSSHHTNRKKSNLLNENSDLMMMVNDHQQLSVNHEHNNNLDSLEENKAVTTPTIKNQTVRLNSQDSQTDYDQSGSGDKPWPRQNSLTMKEWDIPFDDLIREKKIGTGRFGTVFKGKWHGSVAIKMFNMANSLDDKRALEAFRSEVATFRKTRHENLVLFMGACMSPPHLAIVTSYCKGHPLYSHLYERKEKFNLNRIISIGTQISQGMGYLHARGIVHKDLRSKNIFYDNSNNKVIIADFGLFSLTKLCFSNDEHKDRLKIPKGWLCYLAPELMKALKAGSDQEQDDLPFSFSTDVFSFGTIWHELIFGFLPFEGKPAEVVIWQVGKGIKQSLINLQASKEIKDILMNCWAYKPNERPEFSKLVDNLTNLPKKRLQRSPSHPTHLMTKHLY